MDRFLSGLGILLFAVCLLLLPLAEHALGQDLDDIYRLLDNQDYRSAWAKLQPLVQAGNAQAMFEAEVEGKPLTSMNPQDLGNLISAGTAGSIINMKLRRGDRNIAVAMPRDPAVPATGSPAPVNPLDTAAQNPLDRPTKSNTGQNQVPAR